MPGHPKMLTSLDYKKICKYMAFGTKMKNDPFSLKPSIPLNKSPTSYLLSKKLTES